MMNPRRTLVLSIVVLIGAFIPVWTFVHPFGVRNAGTLTSSPSASESAAAVYPACAQRPWNVFWAIKAKKGEEEDDWEPNEEDLSDLEDLSLDDEAVDLEEDNTMVVVEDDSLVTAALEEDEDDEDLDDIDLDIWEEDEEEEEEEEWAEESGTISYLGGEVEYEDEDWEEDEGFADAPIEDDPSDPDYMIQKKIVEETVERRKAVEADRNFDALDYIINHLKDEEAEALDAVPVIQEAAKMASDMMVIDEGDLEEIDLEEALASTPDLMNDDPYEGEGREDILGTGVSDSDLERLDSAYKRIQTTLNQEPMDKVSYKAEITNFEDLSDETLAEMDACLDEIGGSAYNSTRWLLYDLDFNVSNLMLAAVKHNPDAPIIFQHWFPQLLTYSRYQHARDRNFDFTWEDVNNADVEELERYYLGFGYDEIPNKAPAETGIISFEDLDEEEIKMAAFENWMTEVYNPEWDRKDFDDDSFRDEDNVFSDYFEAPQHPDLPVYEDALEDLHGWQDQMDEEGEDNQEYRDFMGKEFKYKYVEDEDSHEEFRGHLVVACAPIDDDLAVAETITKRMDEEFGKAVHVETRVIAHARAEDSVFEVWIESYEIDLLFSRKRASANSDDWDGPEVCDDEQVEKLVEKVGFMISDEARYSYSFENDMVV